MEPDQLREEYKLIADFLGYVYFPYSKSEGIQQKEYPGWYKNLKFKDPKSGTEKDFMCVMHKSPNFVCRKTLELNFKHDWNNLMNVVLAIQNIESQKYGGFTVLIDKGSCLIFSKFKSKESAYSKSFSVKDNTKKAVYESCLMFIRWYNSL